MNRKFIHFNPDISSNDMDVGDEEEVEEVEQEESKSDYTEPSDFGIAIDRHTGEFDPENVIAPSTVPVFKKSRLVITAKSLTVYFVDKYFV